jgi:hypothetical protein
VFAIDVTEHCAARDHWIQRFPTLIGCAQEGIPGAFIAPRDMPNRKKFAGKTDPLFFFTYDRVVDLHDSPIYIAEWQSSDGATLDRDSFYEDLPPHDSKGIANVLRFFAAALEIALHGRDPRSLVKERLIIDLRAELRQHGYQNIPKISEFERLTVNMPNNRPLTVQELKDWLAVKGLKLPKNLPDRLQKRDRVLIFAPTVKQTSHERKQLVGRIKAKGGDPYTQQPLVFDYLFCRNGETPYHRDTWFVIDLSILKFKDFAEYVAETWKSSPLRFTEFNQIDDDIPRYTLHLTSGITQVIKNFVRLYAFTADVIVFSDGVLYF